MSNLEKIKALKAYIDKLEESFCVRTSTDIEETIADYESGELNIEDLDEIYEKIEEIGVEFPDELDLLFYSRDEFEAYMVEIDTIVEVDKSIVHGIRKCTTEEDLYNFCKLNHIECTRCAWGG